MALIPIYCIPSDAPAFAEAYVLSFEPSPGHQLTYGKIPLERRIAMFREKFAKGMESQAHPATAQQNHYLKVTDPATGELMAFAIWQYLPQGYKMEEDPSAKVTEVPEGANEVFLRDFAKMTGKLRGEHEGRKEAHWLLSLLGTHPKHQRKGAAAALIKWPFSEADKGRKRCYVEASSVGYQLYRRCGFEDVSEISVDFDKYGGKGMGIVKWTAMLREPEKR